MSGTIEYRCTTCGVVMNYNTCHQCKTANVRLFPTSLEERLVRIMEYVAERERSVPGASQVVPELVTMDEAYQGEEDRWDDAVDEIARLVEHLVCRTYTADIYIALEYVKQKVLDKMRDNVEMEEEHYFGEDPPGSGRSG